MVFLFPSSCTGYPRYSTFDQLGDRNTVALKKILDRGQDDGVEAVKKVVDFYQSCLNLSYIETLGAGPVMDLINRTGEDEFGNCFEYSPTKF